MYTITQHQATNNVTSLAKKRDFYNTEREKEIDKNKGNIQNILNELRQFNTPVKKKKHIISKLRNKIRNIDYLRVESILNEKKRSFDCMYINVLYC